MKQGPIFSLHFTISLAVVWRAVKVEARQLLCDFLKEFAVEASSVITDNAMADAQAQAGPHAVRFG